jgi:hypothetical protein
MAELVKGGIKLPEARQTKLLRGGVAVDDRGEVGFINDFDFTGVKRLRLLRAASARRPAGIHALVEARADTVPSSFASILRKGPKSSSACVGRREHCVLPALSCPLVRR